MTPNRRQEENMFQHEGGMDKASVGYYLYHFDGTFSSTRNRTHHRQVRDEITRIYLSMHR
jgi:hypothetical protein